MKKIMMSIIAIIMSLVVVACGKDAEEGLKDGTSVSEMSAATLESEKERAVSVYFVKTDAFYVASLVNYHNEDISIEFTLFDNYTDMYTQINTEMMSGKGPDIILYNSLYSEHAPGRLVAAGAYYPLDEFMESLDSEPVSDAILDAGIYEGKQYFLPFSWNIPQVYTTEKLLTEQGYDTADVYDALITETERLLDTDGRTGAMWRLVSGVYLPTIFDAMDVDVTQDVESDTTKKKVEEAVSVVKKLLCDKQKMNSVKSITNKGTVGEAYPYCSFFVDDFPFMSINRFYESQYNNEAGENMVSMPFTLLNEEGVAAQVMQYGAINASISEKQAQRAWEVLKYLYEYEEYEVNMSITNREDWWFAPVCKRGYERTVDKLCTTTMNYPNGMKIKPLSAAGGKRLLALQERITKAVIPNKIVSNIANECLKPYVYDESDFDSCYETLVSKIKIYLSE